jgi:hypothetical protein
LGFITFYIFKKKSLLYNTYLWNDSIWCGSCFWFINTTAVFFFLIVVGFLLIGILDLIFIAFMIKGSGSSASRVATAGGRVWTLVEPGSDTPSYTRGGRVDRKQKKAIQKHYHMAWIVMISVISLLTIFLTFIM